ncbi:MAG: hypothetical protein US74_C0016G0010 [Parcubacteria group bacterium GW2011_GWA2_38_13]|nr:MAG: hypothetical protein US74_C0016G0010 [Parcubacteria group bacterium GW2011_GWA2_38_13]
MKYFEETKRFYYSIFFILPFLAVYEYGLFKGALGTNINGADGLLRYFFYFINTVLGPTITKISVGCIIVFLLGYLMYCFIKHRVKIRWSYLVFMAIESLALAFATSIIIHLSLNRQLPNFFVFIPNNSVVRQLAIIGLGNSWAKIVASVGAGIFEEFVFRVILIRLVYGAFQRSWNGFGKDTGMMVKAAGVSSVVFTFMHWGTVANPFGLISIFLGSVIFSILYIKRGYGIVAGTHVFYDMYLMFGVIG